MDVSFLIPVFNCLPLTRACLESLERTVPRHLQWEVLLIDDGSTDGSRAWFRTLSDGAPERYRVLLNDPPHQGYARNNNRAAQQARGRILCLLNNDTVLLPGWLEPMLHTLRQAPRAALVGNIQREPGSGLINHAGIVFNLRGIPIHFGQDTAVPPDGEPWTRWPAVTAACCVVRRELFRELGGFDEHFQNGFEDIDLCLRAGERGWRHYVANRSTIYHHISASPGRRAHETANLRRYQKLWGGRIVSWRRRRRWRRQRLLRNRQATLPAWLSEPVQHRDVNAPAGRAALAVADDVFANTLPPRGGDAFARWFSIRWQRHCEAEFDAVRQRRQEVVDSRRDGRRYLKKHLLRPWRYNLRRLCHALAQALEPLPPRPGPPAAGAGGSNRPAVDALFAPFEQAQPMPGGLVLFDRPAL